MLAPLQSGATMKYILILMYYLVVSGTELKKGEGHLLTLYLVSLT
jgi:hypothetical protein